MHQLPPNDPGSEASDHATPLKELVARMSNKDWQAFASLYEHYKKPLGKRLQGLVNDQEAAYDLYQDTFVRIWKRVSQQKTIPQETIEHFERWLYRVARNIAIDYLRHNKKIEFLPLSEREPERSKDFIQLEYLATNGHEEIICEMLCLRGAIEEMSRQYRVCLLLQVHWGYSQREIARALGISEKAVSTNVSRGYNQLRMITMHDTNSYIAHPFGEDDGWSPYNPNEPVVWPDFPKGLAPRLQQLWQDEDHNGKSAVYERPIVELLE